MSLSEIEPCEVPYDSPSQARPDAAPEPAIPWEECYGRVNRILQARFPFLDTLDIAQDAALATAKKGPDLIDPEVNAPKYMASAAFRIAQNRVRNNRRRKTNPFDTTDEYRGIDNLPGDALASAQTPLDPQEAAVGSLLNDTLTEVIEALPETDFKVLKYHIEGLSDKEIADAIGVSHSTITSRLFRARAKVRNQLDRTGWTNRGEL